METRSLTLVKHLALMLLALALSCIPALPANWLPLFIKPSAPTYTGPVDVVGSPTAIYSLRAASAAIVTAGTQKIINVSASGTTPANVTCDIIVASNGGLGNTANCSTGSYNASAAAAFCATGSGSCIVEIWYDQSGNGLNETLNTGSVALTFSCIGSLPCLTFNGTNYLCNSTFTTVPQPLTVANSFSATASASEVDFWASNSNAIVTSFNNSGSGILDYYAGSDVHISGISSGLHAFQAVFNGASSASNVDGTNVTGTNPGTGGISASLCIGNAFNRYTGTIQELDFWPIAFTIGQLTSMNTNISGYW